MRLQGVSKHVGALDVASVIALRAGLAFGIGLDQKTAEIRDELIDFICFVFPPFLNVPIQRIGGVQLVRQDHGGCKVGRQVGANSPFTKDVCKGCGFFDIVAAHHDGIGVDVIQHYAVDADGSAVAGILLVAGIGVFRQLIPFPKASSGVSPFHGAVRVVPMVQHSQVDGRLIGQIQCLERLSGLHQPDKMEHTI